MSKYPTTKAASSQKAAFKYVNHRGHDHEYVIDVEAIEYGPYDDGGHHPEAIGFGTWVLHGYLVKRDGQAYNVGDRRTFMLNKIRDLKVTR